MNNEDGAIIKVDMLDMNAVARAVRAHNLLSSILTGQDLSIKCTMFGENNNACGISVSGKNICTDSPDVFASLISSASKVVRYRQESGVEIIAFLFNFVK